MKAWVLHDVNDIRYEDVETAIPMEGEALIRVEAAGICGSDIPRVFETGAHKPSLIIGHEFSGVVESIGKGVDGTWLNRRVGVFPLIPCGKCVPCRRGQYELCRDYDYLGSRSNGGFAEYVTVPIRNLIRLPDGVSLEEAAMLEPMAVAVHALRRGTDFFLLPQNTPIAVCGLGTIGLLLTMFLMEAGYQRVYVIGNKEWQKKKVQALGILEENFCDSRAQDTTEWLANRVGGVDLFFECVGRNETVRLGLDSTRPGGKVVLVGNPHADMTFQKNTYWKILRNQLTVTGTWNSTFHADAEDDWHYVLDRLETHSIAPAELITHRLPLEELMTGLRLIRDKKEDYCKVMIMGIDYGRE